MILAGVLNQTCQIVYVVESGGQALAQTYARGQCRLRCMHREGKRHARSGRELRTLPKGGSIQ